MNGIVNNPNRTVVIPNTEISQSANIVNSILGRIGYEVIGVDNSMSSAHVWTVNHKAQISGLIDTLVVGTYSFKQVGNDLQLTVEAGKGVGSISDQWELQDCNNYMKQALSLAVNPNITYKGEIEMAKSNHTAIAVIIGVICILCMLPMLL